MFNEWKLFVVLFIVLLIFGPKNLPRLAQALGRSVRELKNGMTGISEEIRETVNPPNTSQPAAPKTEPLKVQPAPSTSETVETDHPAAPDAGKGN